MTASHPDPNRDKTPGLVPREGVPPGETPPAEGSMSGAGPRNSPPEGWSKGPLAVILILVVLVAAGLIGYAVSLA